VKNCRLRLPKEASHGETFEPAQLSTARFWCDVAKTPRFHWQILGLVNSLLKKSIKRMAKSPSRSTVAKCIQMPR
jgi:hypothetical protein